MIRKIFFIILGVLFKIANIVGILIAILLGVILYVIIFEVPVNFFNKYIEERIFNNLVKVEKVYLKWDYNIKKPVLVLNDIKYNNPNNKVSFTFRYLGVSFDIAKLITKHRFYPIYINLEGFKLSGERSKDNTYAFNIEKTKDDVIKDFLNKVNTIENNKNTANSNNVVTTDKNTSEMFNIVNVNNITKEGIFNIFMEYRKKYDFLALLTKVDIDTSVVNFKDDITSQNFIGNFNNISFNYNKNTNKLLVQTNAKIEVTNLKKIIDIKGSITADNKRNLFFSYTANNIPPELLLLYSNSDATQNVRTAGLYLNANVEGRYQFPYGMRFVNVDVKGDAGEIFVKNLLLDKVKIDSIRTQLSYNVANASIAIPNFEISLAKNSSIKLRDLKGGNLDISKVNFNANLDFNKHLYNFNNIKLYLSNYLVNGSLEYNDNNINFKADSDNAINITEANKLWPTTVAKEAKSWVVEHVNKAIVNKVQIKGGLSLDKGELKVNDISGTALVSNASVNYIKGMPTAIAPKVRLEFDKKKFIIKYSDGITGNLNSKRGEVSIYNEFPNKKGFHPVLKVNSQAEGNIVDALLFINSEPLYLLNKTKLKSDSFNGNIAGNVVFEYSFTNHKIQNLNIDVVGHNVDYSNAFKGKDIKKANINLAVKDNKLSAYGNGNYYDMPINLYLDASWDKEIPYDIKLNLESKNVPISKLEELNLLPNVLKDIVSGNIDISLENQQLRNSNKQVITANLNLINTDIKSFPYIDYSKKANVPLNAIVNLTLMNGKLTEIKQLTLSNKDISAQFRIALNQDNSTNIVIDKFVFSKAANLRGYLYLSDTDFNINLKGDYLNFEWLRSGYEKEQKNNKTENINSKSKDNKEDVAVEKKPKSYSVKISVKKTESNDTTINNFYINYDSYNKSLNSLVVSGDLNKSDNITVVYDKNSKQIAYNISNLGEALKFLKVSTKIKKGNLNGQINLLQDKGQNLLTDGTVLIKSFNVGIIPFSSARFAFTGKNYDFNIMNLYLKGNVVGGTLAGNYKSQNHYLMLSGYITPIWSASHLLVNIPLLGDFLKSNFAQTFLSGGVGKNNKNTSVNRGAINIAFSLYGNVNNLQYSFSSPKEQQKPKLQKKAQTNNGITSLNPRYYLDNINNTFNIIKN